MIGERARPSLVLLRTTPDSVCALAQSGIRHPVSGICCLFSAKEWDPDAQLYYFGFRWYDPDTGTWTTKDPLGFGAEDENVYRGMVNNAMYLVDPYTQIRRLGKTVGLGSVVRA